MLSIDHFRKINWFIRDNFQFIRNFIDLDQVSPIMFGVLRNVLRFGLCHSLFYSLCWRYVVMCFMESYIYKCHIIRLYVWPEKFQAVRYRVQAGRICTTFKLILVIPIYLVLCYTQYLGDINKTQIHGWLVITLIW